jgi:hypothetical protein
VALDRQSIARSDFPRARRGYDSAAVDRHLAAIADEVQELHRRGSGPAGALATETSEQVRAIIEAAEASAAGIRESATADAREHVARVAEAADALRERIDALDRELTAVLGAVRGGAERLRAELDEVAAGAARLAAAGSGPGVAGRSEVAASALGATLGEAAAEPADEEVGEEPALATVAEVPAEAADRSTDVTSARIVAFERAMEGRPREETDRYLADHFDVPDRASLLDDVYARAAKA